MTAPRRAASLTAGLVCLLLTGLLAGCSSEADPAARVPPAADPTPSGDAAAFNPCDGLSAEEVSRALESDVRKETGSDALARCAFLPVVEGGPTLNVTYLVWDGSLEEAFDAMGDLDGQVSELDLPRADAARLVVNAGDEAVLVTGFVQVGDVIETVNAIQLAPYDADRMARATTTVLTRLARAGGPS
ncbi:hypothetical protein [Nocardioides sp.]|uniref:hypothetical protein n=1 Tax=Nocardioides sp. TaxID=35761 RepID=UPI003565047F